MKNNKTLIIVAVILLNVLVMYMIGQSLMGKTSEYDMTLEEARNYAQQELCAKSIEKYNEALMTKDSIDIRLEMIAVYEKGIDIGEFTNTYEIFSSVKSMVEKYRTEPRAYEEACAMFLKYGMYQECADILMQSRDFNVTSEKIEEYREQVRFQYTKYFAMYTDVLPMYDNMYRAQTEDGYVFLNNEGSPDIKGNFTEASSFSNGYAFVKAPHPDGTDKSFLINKDKERQVYFEGVESSSGVGKAQDKDGNTIYLLSCKVGDMYKYFDINGKEVFGEYKFAGRFRNNVAAVMEADGSWKLINGTGAYVSDEVFSDIVLNEFDECAAKGFIFAAKDGKYSMYDHNMTRIGEFVCDDAKAFQSDYAAFKSGDLWGYVDTKGEVIIEPQYEDAKSFSGGMAAVKLPDGWSFINADNEIVVSEVFEDAGYLTENGICFVKEDGYWSYLKMYYTEK